MAIPSGLTEAGVMKRRWITPIRSTIYVAMLAIMVAIYLNFERMEWFHFIVVMAVVGVCSMGLLDCRVSDEFWEQKDKEQAASKES